MFAVYLETISCLFYTKEDFRGSWRGLKVQIRVEGLEERCGSMLFLNNFSVCPHGDRTFPPETPS